MNRVQNRSGLACAVLLVALSASSLSAQGQRPAENITAEQAISCIRTAIASHPGRVAGLDVDIKGGKAICEVEIAGEDGRKMELQVDVSTNQVVSSQPD
jgi:uncharacterized membrane protein YkoI